MTRKLVDGLKDENGMYVPAPKVIAKEPEPTDIAIDDLLKRGLRAIYVLMRAVETDFNLSPSREMVMNLKDAMTMLRDLKKEERDLLESMTDEQLEKMLKK